MNFDWLQADGLERLPAFVTALAIGLLIGLDRERNPTAKAGLRTCALVALAGALSASLAQSLSAPSIVAVGLGGVAFMMIAAYYHHHETFHEWEPGTTTIAAVVIAYLLGAMVLAGFPRAAVALGIIVTMLLHFKAELGGMAHALERRDVVAIFQFAVVAFIVLPLLPDQGFGPYAALNPRHIWLMVVLISGLSLAGYVALRMVGPRHGPVLLGVLGGLVSSTATTLAYSRYAGSGKGTVALAAMVIVTANLVLLLRLAALAGIVAPAIVPLLMPVLASALSLGVIAFALGDAHKAGEAAVMPPVRNPAELRAALGFAALYGLVLIVSAWLTDLWGSRGAYAVAFASGWADVDAISLTNFRLYGVGELSAGQATAAIVIALSANAVFKLGIVRVAGGTPLFRRCLPAVGSTIAGAVAGLAVFS